MKNLSLRLRYLASYLVLIIPILIFCVALYFSTVDRNIQYINSASLQQFTYSAENISSILSRLDYSARNAISLEDYLLIDSYGRTTLQQEDGISLQLKAIESRLSPNVDLLFYLRGDESIYTSSGKLHFSDWESQYTAEYNLPMSRLFSNLMSFHESTLIPLSSTYQQGQVVGLAYLVPFPSENPSAPAALLYLLHTSILKDEFENYLGQLIGDLYIYDDKYNELFTYSSDELPLIPFDEMIKLRGVGLQQINYSGQELVLMRVTDSQQGLHCAMVVKSGVFYTDLRGTQRIMLFLVLALIIIICILAVWTTVFNYKPISDLVGHITGIQYRHTTEQNELELIKSYYDERIDETEYLSGYLSELMPVVAQQLVSKLIFGKFATQEEFLQMSRHADLPFNRPYTVAFSVLLPSAESNREDCLRVRSSQVIARFQPAACTVAHGELPAENALCVIINYASTQEDIPSKSIEMAHQLADHLTTSGIYPIRIGVGRTYEDPLQMPASFAEANTAVQLAPSGQEQVFLYTPHTPRQEPMRNLRSTPGMALLIEGIHRGDATVAQRGLFDVLQEITEVTDSFTYFHFCCAELLSTMLAQASSLQVPVVQKYLFSLIDFKTQADFLDKTLPFLDYLCNEVRSRIQQEDNQMSQQVLDYILANYKRFDLSIQMVADALNIPKTQITVLLRAAVGQNFVQYVSYLRMNEFKRLLVDTDRPIQECVTEIGYSDVPNFLRKFKSIENVTAGQFRTLHRAS